MVRETERDIQTNVKCLRNIANKNVNTSSDLIVFTNPSFTVTGAIKIATGLTETSSGVTVVTTATTLTVKGSLGEIDSLLEHDAGFKYSIHKYNPEILEFESTAIYTSGLQPLLLEGRELSGLSYSSTVDLSEISLDAEYIIKGHFEYTKPTFYSKRLELIHDTSLNSYVGRYGIYEEEYDWYVVLVANAEKPTLIRNYKPTGGTVLITETFFTPLNETEFFLANDAEGDIIVSVNGVTLQKNTEFRVVGNKLTLFVNTVSTDVISVAYMGSDATNKFYNENISVTGITSGTSETVKVQYNTEHEKYEIFLDSEVTGEAIVSINGVKLASNLDYYVSTSNKKRIIFEGILYVGDVIQVYYLNSITSSGKITTNTPLIAWAIETAPKTNGGSFEIQLADYDDPSFSSILGTSTVEYVAGQTEYVGSIAVSGRIGDKFWYRIKNTKTYTTLLGDVITTIEYSDAIAVEIMTNSINSY